jgi:thiamine transporter ThiT
MNALKKNLLINVSYQLLVVVIPLVVAPYVSRTVGAEGVGVYSYTFNFAYCFALVGMLGVSNYGNRTIAAVGEDKHLRSLNFWNIWAIQILMSLLACAAYGIWCLAAAPQSPRIALVHMITVACSLFDISWFFFGIEKFQITVARNLVVKVLNMALIFGLVKGPEDLAAYTAMGLGGSFRGRIQNPGLSLCCGSILALTCRYICHVLSGYILFSGWAEWFFTQEGFPAWGASLVANLSPDMLGFVYSLVYNGMYMIPEIILTAIAAVLVARAPKIVTKIS